MVAIEITSANISDYQDLDIIAFSFADGGAQGEGGALVIMTSDAKLYHTNFVRTISWEEALILCPVLKETETDYFWVRGPEGWYAIYLGGGNNLVVKEQFKEALSEENPLDLYSMWPEILLEQMK